MIITQWLSQSLGQLWLPYNDSDSHWDNYDYHTMAISVTGTIMIALQWLLTVTGTIMITTQWQCQSLGQLWLPYNDWQSLGQLWLPHNDNISHWDNYDYLTMTDSHWDNCDYHTMIMSVTGTITITMQCLSHGITWPKEAAIAWPTAAADTQLSMLIHP